jgi:hypothetical protein
MRIELPSGNWVEVRENLKGKDKSAVQGVVRLFVTAGQDIQDKHELSGDLQYHMRDALLANVITEWSFDAPIPSVEGGPEAVEELDIDDYNELHAKTEHLFKKVSSKVPN